MKSRQVFERCFRKGEGKRGGKENENSLPKKRGKKYLKKGGGKGRERGKREAKEPKRSQRKKVLSYQIKRS